MLVHHSDKTGTNYRGSSKLATTFEVIIGLHRIDGRAAGGGAGFELRWGKYRGKPTAAMRDMEVTLEGAGEDMRWAYGPAASAEMGALLDAVRSGRYATQRDLAAHLKFDASKVTRLKGRAIGKAEISRAEWEACMCGNDQAEF